MTFTKTLTGLKLKYPCPGCKETLLSKPSEAGRKDACPHCGVEFTVPGKAEVEALREKQRKAKEKAREQREAEEEALGKEQEARAQAARERLLGEVLEKDENPPKPAGGLNAVPAVLMLLCTFISLMTLAYLTQETNIPDMIEDGAIAIVFAIAAGSCLVAGHVSSTQTAIHKADRDYQEWLRRQNEDER